MVQDYEDDIAPFVKELIRKIERNKIKNQIEQSELLAVVKGMQFKKGHILLTKWRRKKLAEIKAIDDELAEDKMNVFEKLIHRNKPKTVFDNLRMRRKK